MFKKTVSVIVLSVMVVICGSYAAFAGPSTIDDMKHEGGKIGTYHALFLAIDACQDKALTPTPTASKSARQLAAVLSEYYGFSTELLLNEKATKEGMIQLLEALAVKMGVSDTVVIFFSGPGQIDSDTRNGYWYPYDADSADKATWLSNDTIQKMIRDIKANDILLISDSAYSDKHFGSDHRLPEKFTGDYYLDMYTKQSRWGLTSGTDGPRGNRISVFSKSIMDVLKKNEKPQLTLQDMYENIKPSVRKASIRPPRCRSLKNTGDQGGEPVFVLTTAMVEKISKAKTANETTQAQKPQKKVTKNTIPKEKPIGESVLTVNVNVPDAEIKMDGAPLGKGVVYKQVVSPGVHLIEIRKKGYQPFEKNVIVKRGLGVTLNAELVKEELEPTGGRLIIKAVPEKSRVRLLDINVPYSAGMMIEKGKHTVEVSSPFYETVTKSIQVVPEIENTYTVTLEPVKVITHKKLGNFVLVPPGEFVMGSPENEAPMNMNEIQHTVRLTKRIYMQEKEMTVGQWRWFIMETRYKTEAETGEGAYILVDYNWFNDSEYNWGIPGFDQKDSHPVVCLSWNDTQAFVSWINKKSSKEAITFRLPTEAEWEYACRAGTQGPFSFGTCLTREQANFDGNVKWAECPVGKSSKGTQDVGTYAPNAWGLYDMHGNVMEWCQDWLGGYPSDSVTDPKGPPSGTVKVVRGGGWTNYAYDLRSAKRLSRDPSLSYSNMGFRLVLEPSGQ